MKKPTATVMVDEPPWTPWFPIGMNAGDPVFKNSRYIVHVSSPQRQSTGFPSAIHLSIRHRLNIAITDFRDFQRIKNELVHSQAEAIQIFPAESRLVDTCNQYHLFVFVPDDFDRAHPDRSSWEEAIIPVGYFYGRDVTSLTDEGTRQRPFDEGVSEEGETQDGILRASPSPH